VEPAEGFFRRQSGRLVSALTRIFGVHNVALAEDVTQDALCRALAVWRFSGVPDDPAAWLMAVAKNRALDILRHDKTARRFAPELGFLLDSEWTLAPTVVDLFEPRAVTDGELRMMFSCCAPGLPEEAQVALILHILCGFSVGEVAGAILSTEAATEKRISRAKKTLASSGRLFDVHDDAELQKRLPVVQRALYLLFNEGYHGASPERAVRVTLCREALHLARMLLDHPPCAVPSTRALIALMCLHAARTPARLDSAGDLIPLREQDRRLWDATLTAEGLASLDASAAGETLSEYHLEAAIGAVHASARSAAETRWGEVVGLYDLLMGLRPSPVVALSRAIAIGERDGPDAGLAAARAIEHGERLARTPFYEAAMGDLEWRAGRLDAAERHLLAALERVRNSMEKRFFEGRLRALRGAATARLPP
jgi:RNA polymerase sigma-70 factor (ECF subfamily)